MALKKGSAKHRNKFQATLVTGDRLPCAFCQREIDDELTYGKLYAIGNIQVHYFCVLLSCCLVQKGKDTEGLFGFVYPDIIAELERSKKHKCSYCGLGGASVGCCVGQCRKQFHLPCGREKNAVSLFYGNYKSYCQQHVPKQKIPEHIMEHVKVRRRKARDALRAPSNLASLKELCNGTNDTQSSTDTESVCVICYEAVDGFPTVSTFWPPCCARDAWFHRTCLQRMALSAGMHYLKCPLCNDKEQFYDAVVSQGYYVPDRDAAWELEQNAFAEIYERAAACGAEPCLCPNGRGHDADTGDWDIKLCILCGTSGCHAACVTQNNALKASEENSVKSEVDEDNSEGTCLNLCENKEDYTDSVRPIRYVCDICMNCAPEDMDSLASRIEAVILAEQRAHRQRANRPMMPSRMSLRRTKARIAGCLPSTSQNSVIETETDISESCTEIMDQKMITRARLDLNLKLPRKRPTTPPVALNITAGNTLLSPIKLIEENLSKKIRSFGVKVDEEKEIVNKIKERLKKPRPLCEKKRIVNSVLENIFNDIFVQSTPPKPPSPKETEREFKNIEVICSNDNKHTTDVNVTLETAKRKRRLKKLKKMQRRRNNSNIQVKIRFKKERVKLKITQSQIKKQKRNKKHNMLLTQYILNVCENSSPNKLLAKPDHDLTPRKRKYVKSEKSPDNLVQTSIQNFFTKVPFSDHKVEE